MQSNVARIGLGIVAVAAAVVLFVVLSGDSDDTQTTTVATDTTPTTPEITTIVVEDGEPVGGVRELTFRKGERARFAVRTDGGEEVHVHGYEITKPVPAGGGTVSFDFATKLDGAFDVELHRHEGESQIAELTIEP